jgi:hypothetical protein
VRFTAIIRRQRSRLVWATAALGVSLLSVTGCGYINPQQTSEQYSASDGIRADVGPLQIRNLMIVSTGEDQPGRVIGAIYNSSSNDVKLTLNGAGGSQTEIPVSKNSHTLLNESTDPAILSTSGGIPGSLVEVKFRESGTGQDGKAMVPVMDGTLPEYKAYLPEGSEPTGTASPESTPTPTPTSSASH